MDDGSVPIDHGDEARRAIRLARLHRRMQYLFLGDALSLVLFGVCIAAEDLLEPFIVLFIGAGVLLSIGIFVIALIAMPLARAGWKTWLVMVATLAIAIALSALSGRLYVGAFVMWIAGPLVAMCVTHRMYKRVKAMGIRVSDMGASERDIAGAALCICVGCGYDNRGLPTDVCPECGKESVVENPASARAG